MVIEYIVLFFKIIRIIKEINDRNSKMNYDIGFIYYLFFIIGIGIESKLNSLFFFRMVVNGDV